MTLKIKLFDNQTSFHENVHMKLAIIAQMKNNWQYVPQCYQVQNAEKHVWLQL